MSDTPDETPLTPEQADAMEQRLMQYRMEQSQKVAADRAAKLKPLTDFVASPEFDYVRTNAPLLARQFTDEPFYDTARLLGQLAANLANDVR